MKRNTVTMFKYIGAAACIMFLGPHLLKSMTGEWLLLVSIYLLVCTC